MKILSITAQKPDSTGSGVYLGGLVQAFAQMGCEQAVVAGITAEDRPTFPEGVLFRPVYYQTEQLPYPVLGMSDEMPYSSTRYCDLTPQMTGQFQEAFGEVLRKMEEVFEPDLIICHHLYLLTALVREWFPQRRVIGICHGSDLRQMKKNPLFRGEIAAGVKRLDRIWALHGEQKKQICEVFGIDGEKVGILGTGYNSRIFYPDAEKKKDDGTSEILFAGKISEKKGIKSLLRAMTLLQIPERKVRLTLAGGWGEEEEFDRICQMAENCPVPVEFTGRIPQILLAERMRKSDVFVLPSFYEGLPLVVVEAMACGNSVVCTDLPGVKSWLDEKAPGHGCRFVRPPAMRNEDEPEPETLPGFEKRLAEALEDAIRHPVVCSGCLENLSWEGIGHIILEDR